MLDERFAERAGRHLATSGEGGIVMRIGLAADHGGFALKLEMAEALRSAGHEVVDFGARTLTPGDDYPD